MISIIKDEPLNKYTGDKLESHTFIYKFSVACDISGVPKEVFNTWCDDVNTGFIDRNMMSLPIKECHGIPGVMIDTRLFINIAQSNNEQ